MIVIDTDHITYLKFPQSDRGKRLIGQMTAVEATEIFAISIVTIEERMRGWLAMIAKERQALRQVIGYRELAQLFDFYHEFSILPFDNPVAEKFNQLRAQKLRIATMDLKIAATAIVHDAILLSANRRDFEKVPGLRVENWLD